MKIFNKKFNIDLITIFTSIVLFSIVFTFIFNYFVNGNYLQNSFRGFYNLEDHADHILGLIDKNTYPSFRMVFPPFSYLIYDFFLHIDKSMYQAIDTYHLSHDTYHFYYFFAIFQLFLYMFIINKFYKNKFNENKIFLFCIAVIFSYPVYYATLFKGNNVLTVVLMLLVVAYYFEKKNMTILENFFVMILISISASYKIIPAIYGIEYIRRKEYKKAIALIVLGLLFFILPFLYFDGINTFKRYLSILSEQNMVEPAKTSIFYYLNIVTGKLFDFDIFVNNFVFKIIQFLFLLINIFLYFISHKKWHRYIILSFVCYAFIPRSYVYYLIYYTVPLVIFFCEEFKMNLKNKYYVLLFSLLFASYLFHYTEFVHFMISNLLVISVYVDVCFNFLNKLKH